MSKVCSKCNEEKEEDQFYLRKDTGKRRSECISCTAKRNRKWTEEHSEEMAAYKREWYEENSERILEKAAEYRVTNADAVKRAIVACWEKNGDAYRAAKVKRTTERRKTDPVFKLIGNLRHRVYMAIKKSGGQKTDSTNELLGCSVQHVRAHLESQFTEGMTWENQGEWHIDHIRPCASFNLEDPEEQKKCFHWTNLQPLWARDNIRKGAKFVS
jgi:hypothetical protein